MLSHGKSRFYLGLFCGFALFSSSASADLPASDPLRIMFQQEIDHGTHRITYVRIAPPRLPVLPALLIEPPPTLTPEQTAADEALAYKPYEHLDISTTVYVSDQPGQTVTELAWWRDGRRFRAWSNADFRLLAPLSQLETADRVFGWFPFIGEIDVAALSPEELPEGRLLFDGTDPLPHYFVEGPLTNAEDTATVLDGLDHLHAYYHLHRERLAMEYAALLAHNAALAAERERNPPRPKDTVIHFWKTPAVR